MEKVERIVHMSRGAAVSLWLLGISTGLDVFADQLQSEPAPSSSSCTKSAGSCGSLGVRPLLLQTLPPQPQPPNRPSPPISLPFLPGTELGFGPLLFNGAPQELRLTTSFMLSCSCARLHCRGEKRGVLAWAWVDIVTHNSSSSSH